MTDPYVVLTVTWTGTAGTQTTGDIYRSAVSAAGPWTFLQTVPLLGQRAVFYDTGAPIGTPVWYRAIGHPGTNQELFAGPAQLPQEGSVWVKDPLRPWADRDFDFCSGGIEGHSDVCSTPNPERVWVGFGDRDREEDAGLFPLTGSETPAVVWSRRKSHGGTISFMTRTLDAKDEVYDLFTAGGPLMLQLPPVYGQPDIYIQPGRLRESYLYADQRRPHRMWTMPYTVVDAPVGPKQGSACANWCVVEEVFPTFADLAAAGGTYQDLAAGTLVCGTSTDGYGDGLYGDGIYGG
ncbi:hypothetical protein [Streptomyces sp. 35G-GA-8]|uniref:hypothetical protein n=1 Tax=Streptomyces sp. 35G-GA-8 TaxID=2939434 RepID=UPI00201F81A0|nr:hypothetical protein [Streptomyces sp. 35G-GA-8]MCL7377487.1 hypothetical protein [Streptomyces sp. 35G-GA-8]